IVFSDFAHVVSPLTFDREYLLQYVDMVDMNMLAGEGMTAIGDAVTLANYVLAVQAKGGPRRGRVIIVFTDGENNRGRDPIEAVGEAAGAGVKVHLVGVDLEKVVARKPEVGRLIATVK